jgi:hypothetical protein
MRVTDDVIRGSLASLMKINVNHLRKTNILRFTSEDKMIPIVLFNNLPWTRADYFNIKVEVSGYLSVELNNKTIPSEVVRRKTENGIESELFFEVNVPPMGYSTFEIKRRPWSQTPANQKDLEPAKFNTRVLFLILNQLSTQYINLGQMSVKRVVCTSLDLKIIEQQTLGNQRQCFILETCWWNPR